MTMQLESGAIRRYRGLSTAEKPGLRKDRSLQGTAERQEPPVGSVFTELDTGCRYVWTGDQWERQEQTVEELLVELVAINSQILTILQATHRGHEEYSWGEEVEPE